jgi:hypothetical protein
MSGRPASDGGEIHVQRDIAGFLGSFRALVEIQFSAFGRSQKMGIRKHLGESAKDHQETIKSSPSWDNLVTGSSPWVPKVRLVDSLPVTDRRGRRHTKNA